MFPPDAPISKRLFDLLVAAIGLLAISPILLVVAILVRIYHGSPVLFGQKGRGCMDSLSAFSNSAQ